MAQDAAKKLQHELDRIRRYSEEGTLPEDTTEALLEWATALHPERNSHEYINQKGERSDFAIMTVGTYLREMRKVAERACPNLLELDAETFNEEIDAMNTGENPNVKAGGLAKTTLAVTQSAGRTFFWYFGIAHPKEVTVYKEKSDPKHDERDLFTREDVEALRTQVNGRRNRALLEMLLNTGQRISAIQGLRIKDVDADEGCFYLNTQRPGLKRAEKRGRKRPLFGAEKHVREWLNAHPFADRPEAYLFIGDPDHHKTKSDEPLCQGTIRRMLQRTAEQADVNKPVNPHNFRHFWVTMMKQDYNLNDEEIKLLMGHKRTGDGVNQIYNHSIDEKLRTTTERKAGCQKGTTEKPLTPDSCKDCGEELEDHWQLCPVCGSKYGPVSAEDAERSNARTGETTGF